MGYTLKSSYENPRVRICCILSGRNSNFQALITCQQRDSRQWFSAKVSSTTRELLHWVHTRTMLHMGNNLLDCLCEQFREKTNNCTGCKERIIPKLLEQNQALHTKVDQLEQQRNQIHRIHTSQRESASLRARVSHILCAFRRRLPKLLYISLLFLLTVV